MHIKTLGHFEGNLQFGLGSILYFLFYFVSYKWKKHIHNSSNTITSSMQKLIHFSRIFDYFLLGNQI